MSGVVKHAKMQQKKLGSSSEKPYEYQQPFPTTGEPHGLSLASTTFAGLVMKWGNRGLSEPHRKYIRKDKEGKIYSQDVPFQPAETNIPALVRWTGHLIEKEYENFVQ